MKLETRDRLRRLREASDKEYGKLVQKLLAIALLEAGGKDLTERSIQGVDLTVTLGDRKIALEVKTTHGAVKFGKKDLDGLLSRVAEGYEPFFAVLGTELLDEWIFARYHDDELKANQDLSPTRLRPYRDRELEALVSGPFDAALARHVDAAIDGGQTALTEIIKGYEEALTA